ncbi:MAG: selenium metabolism-associated LysR family transcriptional regulator [bacterium]
MDIRQLEVFYHVARLKSFSKAGRVVGLTQPSVSGSVSSLEQALGLKLFNRMGREVCLTQPGKVLFPYAQKILALRRDAVQQLESLGRLEQGSLMIGASSIPGEYLLPRLIQGFSARYPGIFCTLKVSDSRKVMQALLDHEVEIGVVGTRGGPPGILFEPLVEDRMVVCCAGNHPWAGRDAVSPEELLTQPFLMREEGSGTRREIEMQLSSAHIDVKGLRVVAEMGSTEAIKQAVKAGYGITILSEISVRDLEAAGTVRSLHIQGIPLVRHFFIAELKARIPSPAHRYFKQEMLKRNGVRS